MTISLQIGCVRVGVMEIMVIREESVSSLCITSAVSDCTTVD